jgi:hypothetical protein
MDVNDEFPMMEDGLTLLGLTIQELLNVLVVDRCTRVRERFAESVDEA